MRTFAAPKPSWINPGVGGLSIVALVLLAPATYLDAWAFNCHDSLCGDFIAFVLAMPAIIAMMIGILLIIIADIRVIINAVQTQERTALTVFLFTTILPAAAGWLAAFTQHLAVSGTDVGTIALEIAGLLLFSPAALFSIISVAVATFMYGALRRRPQARRVTLGVILGLATLVNITIVMTVVYTQ